MIDNKLLNRWSHPVPNVIEQGAVRKFAQAIGDDNPIYQNEVYAQTTRYGRLIAPPTFAITLDYGVIDGLSIPQAGLIHGEQSFTYTRPLFVGEKVWCSLRLTDVNTRKGSSGQMTFLVYERRCVDEAGLTIQTDRMNIIVKGGANA